ncbi:FG-GAP repeat-containing protein [Nannocystis exedens]|uniref:FG-GAP repeat-containing protein n=1 Tax=Nannocystis exedens TaxID=54 RepID=A0A1I2BWH7_9BACT|nr:integrin alpha [Nannocystis exedens]PCC71252.1 hypothetical protein NAEX_04326 [Nannocystis exedens]SFE59690.1 FG-GAP repeat-containing protein [Nannocystis exedens]
MARDSVVIAATTLGMVFAPALAQARGPDFDRDGYEDLAIGAPGENVGSIAGAGAVNILYGSASGLDDPADRITTLYQDAPDVFDASEAGDAQVLYTASSTAPSLVAGEQWTQADIDTQLTEPEDTFGAAFTASRPIGVRPASECIM